MRRSSSARRSATNTKKKASASPLASPESQTPAQSLSSSSSAGTNTRTAVVQQQPQGSFIDYLPATGFFLCGSSLVLRSQYLAIFGVAVIGFWVVAKAFLYWVENGKIAGISRFEINRAYKEFVAKYPDFEKTPQISRLRQTDFSRLDEQKHVYLDYTGGGLHGETQLREHFALLSKQTFGNPHSSNPTSLAMTKLVEKTRSDILKFFNTDEKEYDCIFTNNCSGALRIVGESYPFQRGGVYMLPSDNHNSVNGIREFAKSKGASVKYLHVNKRDLRMDLEEVTESLNRVGARSDAPKLFAFPAQSNFSGVKHPLELIGRAQQAGWDVLLDAAAFSPTSKVDLSVIKPDFMPVSFYKIFGYPTGMGALLVKRSALKRLTSRPWFAGGTIEVALVSAEKHWLHQDHEAFEDGTINYLNIPALSIGLDFINRCGMDNITMRIRCMTAYLLDEFKGMKHSNGRRLITFYGPDGVDMRGGTIALNAFDPEGQWNTCWEVEALANDRNISIRAGCFCNPGDSEAAFQWEDIEEKAENIYPMTKGNFSANVPVAGAVRVSVGIPTNFNDLYACVRLFKDLIDRPHHEVATEVARINGTSQSGPH